MRTLVSLGIGFLAHSALVVSTATIHINLGSLLQRIDGFGFSQAFGRAAEFQNASTTLQKQALDLLFSTETGAGFSIIRNWIPSTTALSIEPISPGSASNAPNYTWDGNDEGQLWFARQAVRYGVTTIYADAWSPPGFMKTSGDEATPGYLCGTTGHDCTTGDWRTAFAAYLVQYVKYYKKSGLDITHIGFLNEPDYVPDYSQMQISPNAQEAISFIPMLYRTIKDARLDLHITCCDATGWSIQSNYTNALVNAGMEEYLGIISSHMYSSDATFPLNTSLPTWLTEAGVETSGGRFTTTWHNNGSVDEGMTWANKLATGFIDAGLSAYLFWEGFEINQTQSASHLVDVSGIVPQPSGIFYAFSMWSRFIRPGAHRIETRGSISNVATAAFQNIDDSVVVVFTNSGTSSQAARIEASSLHRTSVRAWLTDSTHHVASTLVKDRDSTFEVTVPALSVVTVKFG